MNRWICWGAASWTLLAALTAEAAECKIAVGGAAATIQFSTGAASFNKGLHTISCEPPARVISGEACFFIDEIGAPRAVCVKELAGDKRVYSSMAGQDASSRRSSSGGSSIFASLMDEVQGRPRKTQGGKKAQGADALAGFPYGEVLTPQGDLVISTKAVSEGPVTAFTIEDKTARKKLNASLAGSLIRVSGRDIVAGHSYNWAATVAGAARTGSFSVTTLAEEPDLSAELATAAKSPDLAGNATALAVARALILYEHQFVFDAVRAIDGAAPAR